jgi:hypothetical protein
MIRARTSWNGLRRAPRQGVIMQYASALARDEREAPEADGLRALLRRA